jgi:predicted nucleic acid-binding protein
LAGVIVLDASVVIAFLDADDSSHDAAEALLVREIDDDLGINPLTLAEVLVAPARNGQLDAALAVVRDLDVRTLRFPDDAAVRLARLRAATGLGMPDCCVLLTAEQAAARLATFDDGLAHAAGRRDVPVLRE